MSDKPKDKATEGEKSSDSATHEPWKRPGQTSQDPTDFPAHDERVFDEKARQKQDR